jgi:D-ribose pyranase
MKRQGLLNPTLLRIISQAGHGDLISITDRGFPLATASSTEVVELSITSGVPSLLTVAIPVMRELQIESLVLAQETVDRNPGLVDAIRREGPGVEEIVSHAEFKRMVLGGGRGENRMIAQVRSGEFTAYANVILVCGVPF